MLVLTRQQMESIVIDGGIKITVMSIRRGKVRLGIEAPAKTVVHRQEVCEAINRELQEAANRREAEELDARDGGTDVSRS